MSPAVTRLANRWVMLRINWLVSPHGSILVNTSIIPRTFTYVQNGSTARMVLLKPGNQEPTPYHLGGEQEVGVRSGAAKASGIPAAQQLGGLLEGVLPSEPVSNCFRLQC